VGVLSVVRERTLVRLHTGNGIGIERIGRVLKGVDRDVCVRGRGSEEVVDLRVFCRSGQVWGLIRKRVGRCFRGGKTIYGQPSSWVGQADGGCICNRKEY
jgi:hypothetical protein